MRKARIATKLEEAAAKYKQEAFTRMYIALAGTDCQILVDTLEQLFGEAEETEEPDPTELDPPAIKKQRLDAATKEVEAAGGEPSTSETIVRPKELPMPPDFGLDPEMTPRTISRDVVNNKTKKVTTAYFYECPICGTQSRNRASMMNDTRRCLGIKVGCPLCPKTADSVKTISDHIIKVHGGKCKESDLTKEEAQALVASLVAKEEEEAEDDF